MARLQKTERPPGIRWLIRRDMDEVLAAMDELMKKEEEELCKIRDTERRGNPLKVLTYP